MEDEPRATEALDDGLQHGVRLDVRWTELPDGGDARDAGDRRVALHEDLRDEVERELGRRCLRPGRERLGHVHLHVHHELVAVEPLACVPGVLHHARIYVVAGSSAEPGTTRGAAGSRGRGRRPVAAGATRREVQDVQGRRHAARALGELAPCHAEAAMFVLDDVEEQPLGFHHASFGRPRAKLAVRDGKEIERRDDGKLGVRLLRVRHARALVLSTR